MTSIGFETRLREELEKKDIVLIGIKKPLFKGEAFGEPLPEHVTYILVRKQEVATSLMVPDDVFEDERAASAVSDCVCVALEMAAE